MIHLAESLAKWSIAELAHALANDVHPLSDYGKALTAEIARRNAVPITITWTGQDVPSGPTETHSRTFTDRLEAARTISSIGLYENTTLVSVTSDDIDGFRAYCETLKPFPVRW